MAAYYAHSGALPDLSDGELLSVHLHAVGVRAKSLAVLAAPMDEDLRAAAFLAGLLHDLGKYQREWQAYLWLSTASQGKAGKSVPHAIHGAAHAFRQLHHEPLALAIAGHHAGLDNSYRLANVLEGDTTAPAGLVKELAGCAEAELADFPMQIQVPQWPALSDEEAYARRLEFWTRLLFSILVDADRLETERFYTKRQRRSLSLVPTTLLALLDVRRRQRAGTKMDQLTVLRNRVFAECLAAGNQAAGFFDLTVPTGGGKTLSGMAFALSHAATHGLRRVIVVIPYLSIIEQNAREYRDIFGAGVVLEHHSAVAMDDFRPPSGEPYPDATRKAIEQATENWDAPLIVTTSVQFLETLLAASPRRCRRLHNVAQSVIIFDEAQCLPTHLLNPLLDIFRDLVTNWGCSVVLSTATQPAFRYSPLGLTHGLKENELTPILAPDFTQQLFADLQRVSYRNETATPWTWDELVARLIEGPALCVLNTRRHAREVWEKLRAAVAAKYGPQAADAVRHLSSAMCPQHRIDVLGRKEDPQPGTVYRRLLDKQDCCVVSTQVIEAGVDIDFPRVFRALGPLDAIVQAGGRCNREGTLANRGEVTIFCPADSGMPQGVYATATALTAMVLNGTPSDRLATDPTVFAAYFTNLFNCADADAANIQKLRGEYCFRSVADAARVIEDASRSVIVPYKSATKWVRRIRRRRVYDRAELRRLQRYTVNLRPHDFAQAQQLGLVRPLVDGHADGPWVLLEGSYDANLGVVLNGLTPEQLIV